MGSQWREDKNLNREGAMKEIYLCRHGETEWTISGQHTGKTDVRLTEAGFEQAKRLKNRLESTKFSKIFTSSLSRAKDTCNDPNAVVDPNLVEWNYGDYEGLTTEQIHEKNPNWNLFKDGAPNGESIADVGKRADLFLKSIQDVEGNIAVFSHGHFIRVIAARYLGLEASKGGIFSLSVASLSILGQEHNNPVINLWNDNHHLD